MTATTREQIIQAAGDLLESQGYHATGLNQIVQVSGAPKGSLYYHFPAGKEQIAAEAVSHAAGQTAARIRENLAAVPDPGEALRAFAENIAHHIEASGFRAGGPLMTVALETATSSERLNLVCRDCYDLLRAAFVEKLSAGGYNQAQADQLAMVILATLEGAILLSRTYHSGDALRLAGEQLARLLHCTPPEGSAGSE
jgi:TetR/AcrR family transcriptional regulator, lmrAB and yxaGH operons repressor